MSYRIELIPPARDEIRALAGYVRAQALDLVAALGQEPRPPRAKRLRVRPRIYRIWLAGRWRVAYQIDDQARRILVLCLRRKENVDYHRLNSWMHESGTDFAPESAPAARTPAQPLLSGDRPRRLGRSPG